MVSMIVLYEIFEYFVMMKVVEFIIGGMVLFFVDVVILIVFVNWVL